jgi:succinyl-diaminopimelate desuccinylase
MAETAGGLLAHVAADEIVQIAQKLVRIDSVNPPGAEQKVARAIVDLLESEGIAAEIQDVEPGRPNALGIVGDPKGRPSLVLCAHTDTVPFGDLTQWKHAPLDADIEDGRLWGRGATDDKGNLAAMISALIGIQRAGIRLSSPVVLAAVCDEEVSHKGIHAFLKHEWSNASMALVGEWSGATRAILGYRGALVVEIIVHGRGAHGSRPEYGVNAIDKMVERVLPCLRETPLEYESTELFEQRHPTFNLGIIEGGTKVNMVPDRCRALLDIRIMPGQSPQDVFKQLSEALDALQEQEDDLSVDVKLCSATDPFLTPEDTLLVEHLAASIETVTKTKPSFFGKSSTCDANILSKELRIPVAVYGPGNPSTHGPDEYVDIPDLVDSACVLYEFTRRVCTEQAQH